MQYFKMTKSSKKYIKIIFNYLFPFYYLSKRHHRLNRYAKISVLNSTVIAADQQHFSQSISHSGVKQTTLE